MTLSIEKAVQLAKPFVGSLRKKQDARPILKTALVTQQHVITTDATYLVRISHNEELSSSYLHHYKESTKNLEVPNYPQIERLLPDTYDAQHSFTIDLKEWIQAHDLGLIAAKGNDSKNDDITLQNDKLLVNKPDLNFDSIGFAHSIEPTNIEKVTYNCKKMLEILKTFKKAKQNNVTVHYYGPFRPIYFKSEEVEAILLPIRKY